ncbi:hypothetical protein OAC88_00400 [Flavobacteriaceae bacterium]|nr:hypothetical protein [Flavobacteriaceae bacterium]
MSEVNKIANYNQMMSWLTRPSTPKIETRENFGDGPDDPSKVDGRTTKGIDVERRNVIKNIIEQDIEDFNKNRKLYPNQKYPLNVDSIQKIVKEQTGTLPDTYLINESLEKVDPEIKSNVVKVEKGGTTSLTPNEEKLFANNYNKKTISQMATEITGLPYDNKITKAKNAQLYRYHLTQKKLGNIEEVVKGTRPKGSTPQTEKGFGAYKKAQKDLMNLDPDTYKDLTPAQVDGRLKKALQFSKVRGAFDVPTSLTPSFEHFQGITPGTITQDPDALRKVGITTQDFNFNVLGAKAKNNIYKTIKNELRTAKEAVKLGDNKAAKESLNTINEIYDDVAIKLKTVKRDKLPKYNLSKNLIKETNLKAVDFDIEKRLGNTIDNYVRFVAAGPKKDVAKIKQPNLKKAVQLVKKGDDQAVKDLIDSRLPAVRSGQLFSNPMADPALLKQGLKDMAKFGKYAGQIALSTPAGAVLATKGLGGTFDPRTTEGRLTAGAEAAFAPGLVKGTEAFTKNKILQKVLNLGLSPKMAMRAARIASPIGIATLAGEGIYQGGKYMLERKELLESLTDEQRDDLLSRERSEAIQQNRRGDPEAFSGIMAANGGLISRQGFADGPDDPSKRKFMKIAGGLASIPILGKFLKPAVKVAPAVIETVKRSADGIPEFLGDLVTKVVTFGKKNFTGNRADEFADQYRLDDYVVTQQGNKTTIKKVDDKGEFGYKEHEMELETDPETGGLTYNEASARPDAEGKLKDVEEFIDDFDLEEMKKYTYDE